MIEQYSIQFISFFFKVGNVISTEMQSESGKGSKILTSFMFLSDIFIFLKSIGIALTAFVLTAFLEDRVSLFI